MLSIYNCDGCTNQYDDPTMLETVLLHDWESNKYDSRSGEGQWKGFTVKYCRECTARVKHKNSVGFGK